MVVNGSPPASKTAISSGTTTAPAPTTQTQ
jgi:hypothetical protein